MSKKCHGSLLNVTGALPWPLLRFPARSGSATQGVVPGEESVPDFGEITARRDDWVAGSAWFVVGLHERAQPAARTQCRPRAGVLSGPARRHARRQVRQES